MTAAEEESGPRSEVDVDDAMAFGRAIRNIRRAPWLLSLNQAWESGQGNSGLEAGEVDTLDEVAMNRGATMSEIAEGLQVTRSTATRAVARLEKRGYAERYRDAESARHVRVQLTKHGLAAYWELMDIRVRFLLRVFARLDDREQEAMAKLLPRVAEIIVEELVAQGNLQPGDPAGPSENGEASTV